MNTITKRLAAAAALIVGATTMGACSFSDDSTTDPAFVTLRYEGGDTGGSKFKEIVEPGEKLATNDRLYAYPRTQRFDKWDTENFKQGANSADYGDMELTAKGGVLTYTKVTVPFTLNTDPKPVTVDGHEYPGGVIQAYHEIFGKTRNAYFDTTTDGNGSYGDGWLWMMDTFISTCTNQVLTPEVRSQEAEDLWLKDEVRVDISSRMREAIQTCVDNTMETDLQFYVIGNPTVDNLTPDAAFVSIYRERQDAETKAETAEFNKEAKVKEAEANAAVAKAEAEIKKAEIAGYGGFDNYARLQAIESGLNPYQPTYLVNGTKQ